jgi:xanthine dehydrogenase accessory factor
MNAGTAARMSELTVSRVPFVHATVVRAQVPSSAHAGDDAIVLSDGTIEGFVGGVCAESSVRTAALGALSDGATVLLRVLPDDSPAFPDSPGAQVVVNPCLSGGALEIFLQPMLPTPLIEVVGATPVADAVVQIAALLGYATARADSDGAAPVGVRVDGAAAVIVASHGRGELGAIRAALDAGVAHIALVASPKRGAAVLAELNLTADELSRIRTPAGLDIGASTAPEVALSIMAEFVARLRSAELQAMPARARAAAPTTAIDPVCGMIVTVMPDTPHLRIDDADVWFCNPGCRDRFAAQTQDA